MLIDLNYLIPLCFVVYKYKKPTNLKVLCGRILKICISICTVICYMQKHPRYANICKINYYYSLPLMNKTHLKHFLHYF